MEAVVTPALVVLAAAALGVCGWVLGRRSALRQLPPATFDQRLSSGPPVDLAARVAGVVDPEDERVELQFALGTLFRRRGELERATALHKLMSESGPTGQRERACFELARDYLSAGLMDRAERLLTELRASAQYREAALERLAQLYEQQRDWADALRTLHEMPPTARFARRNVGAHYLCELAEHALLQGDLQRAEALLKQARGTSSSAPRALALLARLAEIQGEPARAVELYGEAILAFPNVLLELLPRVIALLPGDHAGVWRDLKARLLLSSSLTERQLDVAFAAATREGSAGARAADSAGIYQCVSCGLRSVRWYWSCPSCRDWDCLQPTLLAAQIRAN